MRALYLCYFGLREPLVQTQVLPYLRELARDGTEINLLTFEPGWPESWPAGEAGRQRTRLAASGIVWHARRYHKRPTLPATLLDILVGILFVLRHPGGRSFDLLHARSHVPLAMALPARLLTGAAVIFDLRGLLADEYVDAGVWRQGSIVYRVMKQLERWGLAGADWLIVLTERMKREVLDRGWRSAERMTVIPCCIDGERFRAAPERPELSGSPPEFELIYAGSVTGLYLLEEMAEFCAVLRQSLPQVTLRLLTAAPPAEVRARLSRTSLDPALVEIGQAAPAAVPGCLARAAVGLSFRKPTFSQLAASPTKIPEYLQAGLPVVTNAGIGDTDELIEDQRVGVVIRDLTPRGYAAAVERLIELRRDPALAARCREVAAQYFDLVTVGGARYRSVYRGLRRERPE